jgi:hypothetical protein
MMINCKEASRLLSQAQERSLDRRERSALRFHLLMCSMCRNFEKQLVFIRTAMRRYAQ